MQRATEPLFLGIDYDGESARGLLVDVATRRVLARASLGFAVPASSEPTASLDRICEMMRAIVRRCCSGDVAAAPIGAIALGLPDAAFETAAPRELEGALRASARPLELAPEAADWLGLAAGTLCASILPRSTLAAIGAGATREGCALVSCSTRLLVVTPVPPTFADPDRWVEVHHGAVGEPFARWTLASGDTVIDELRTGFSTTDDLDPAALELAAAQVPPGAHGVSVLPFFAVERNPPLAEPSAAIVGLTKERFRASILHRAALEALAYHAAAGIDRMRALGAPIDLIRFARTEGAHPLRAELLAAICETPVVSVFDRDLEARGAAVVGAATYAAVHGDAVALDELAQEFTAPADDLVEPDADLIRVYRPLAERYHATVRRLHRARRGAPSRVDPARANAGRRRQGLLFEP